MSCCGYDLTKVQIFLLFVKLLAIERWNSKNNRASCATCVVHVCRAAGTATCIGCVPLRPMATVHVQRCRRWDQIAISVIIVAAIEFVQCHRNAVMGIDAESDGRFLQVPLPITVIVSSCVPRTSYCPFHSIPLLVLGDTQSIKRPGRRAGKCYEDSITRRRQDSQPVGCLPLWPILWHFVIRTIVEEQVL